MVSPVCVRCHQPINHDHLQFEGERPVHKSCWGKFPVHQDDLPIPPLPGIGQHRQAGLADGRVSGLTKMVYGDVDLEVAKHMIYLAG